MVDRDQKIVYFNRKFVSLWKIPQSLLDLRDDPKTISFVLSQLKDPLGFHKKIAELYALPEAESYDTLEFLDGKVFERYSRPQQLGDKIVGRVWSFQNISYQRKAETALKEAVLARENFISIASHELKTPITSISLNLQFLSKSLSSGKAPLSGITTAKVLEALQQQFGRLIHLLDNLLDVSRIRTGRLEIQVEPVDLKLLMDRVLQSLSGSIEESGCPIETFNPEPLRKITGCWDPSRIEQVLNNLITNALKYGARNPVRIETFLVGHHVHITVEDHGIGISTEDLSRIFNRFERAVPAGKYGGLGLGLFISKEIITAHGGTVRVASEIGKGSKFTVDLPLGL